MNTWLLRILFGINGLLVLAMLIIWFSVLRQAKRVSGLAGRTRELVDHFAKHDEAQEPAKKAEG